MKATFWDTTFIPKLVFITRNDFIIPAARMHYHTNNLHIRNNEAPHLVIGMVID